MRQLHEATTVGPAAPTSEPAAGSLTWHVWPGHDSGSGAAADFPDDMVPLKGIAVDAARMLASLTVLVIGLGAVGARLLAELARLGIGTLVGVDPDSYGPESWQTQVVRRGVDTGRSKAQLQGEVAHAINPAVTVATAQGFAQDLPLWIVRGADLIVVAGDNLEVLVWAGVMGAALGKMLLQGAVFGEQWVGYVRSFGLADPQAACPACALGSREWSMLTERHGCDPHTARVQGIAPTRTLPPVCGLSADLLAGEVLKHLVPAPAAALDSEELAYCALTHRLWRTKYARNEECRCPHERWQQVDVRLPTGEVTLAMLLRRMPGVAGAAIAPGVQVRGERPFARFTFCPACDAEVPVQRFAQVGEPVGRCKCGEPLQAIPMGTCSVIPEEDLRACLDVPLARMGLPPGGAIGIALDDQWTYFFVGSPTLLESLDASHPRHQRGDARTTGSTKEKQA